MISGYEGLSVLFGQLVFCVCQLIMDYTYISPHYITQILQKTYSLISDVYGCCCKSQKKVGSDRSYFNSMHNGIYSLDYSGIVLILNVKQTNNMKKILSPE